MSTSKHACLSAIVLASALAVAAPSTTVFAYNGNNHGHHYGQLKHPKQPPAPRPPQPAPGPTPTATQPPTTGRSGGVKPAAIVVAAASGAVSMQPSTGAIHASPAAGLVAEPARVDPRVLVVEGILAALMGLWLLLVLVAVLRAYRRRPSPEGAGTWR